MSFQESYAPSETSARVSTTYDAVRDAPSPCAASGYQNALHDPEFSYQSFLPIKQSFGYSTADYQASSFLPEYDAPGVGSYFLHPTIRVSSWYAEPQTFNYAPWPYSLEPGAHYGMAISSQPTVIQGQYWYEEQPDGSTSRNSVPDVRLPGHISAPVWQKPMPCPQVSEGASSMFLSDRPDKSHTAEIWDISTTRPSSTLTTWHTSHGLQTSGSTSLCRPEVAMNSRETLQDLLKATEDIAGSATRRPAQGVLHNGYTAKHPRSCKGNYEMEPVNRELHPFRSGLTELQIIQEVIPKIQKDLDKLHSGVPSECLIDVLACLGEFRRRGLYRVWRFTKGKAHKGFTRAQIDSMAAAHRRNDVRSGRRANHKARTKVLLVRLLEVVTNWMKKVHQYGADEEKTRDFDAVGRAIVNTGQILQRRFEEVLPWN